MMGDCFFSCIFLSLLCSDIIKFPFMNTFLQKNSAMLLALNPNLYGSFLQSSVPVIFLPMQ